MVAVAAAMCGRGGGGDRAVKAYVDGGARCEIRSGLWATATLQRQQLDKEDARTPRDTHQAAARVQRPNGLRDKKTVSADQELKHVHSKTVIAVARTLIG